MTAVIIYGPPGSGKSTHRKALAAHYNKSEIIEAEQFAYKPEYPHFDDNALVLTADEELARERGAIHIKDACLSAGLIPHPMLMK